MNTNSLLSSSTSFSGFFEPFGIAQSEVFRKFLREEVFSRDYGFIREDSFGVGVTMFLNEYRDDHFTVARLLNLCTDSTLSDEAVTVDAMDRAPTDRRSNACQMYYAKTGCLDLETEQRLQGNSIDRSDISPATRQLVEAIEHLKIKTNKNEQIKTEKSNKKESVARARSEMFKTDRSPISESSHFTGDTVFDLNFEDEVMSTLKSSDVCDEERVMWRDGVNHSYLYNPSQHEAIRFSLSEGANNDGSRFFYERGRTYFSSSYNRNVGVSAFTGMFQVPYELFSVKPENNSLEYTYFADDPRNVCGIDASPQGDPQLIIQRQMFDNKRRLTSVISDRTKSEQLVFSRVPWNQDVIFDKRLREDVFAANQIFDVTFVVPDQSLIEEYGGVIEVSFKGSRSPRVFRYDVHKLMCYDNCIDAWDYNPRIARFYIRLTRLDQYPSSLFALHDLQVRDIDLIQSEVNGLRWMELSVERIAHFQKLRDYLEMRYGKDWAFMVRTSCYQLGNDCVFRAFCEMLDSV